MYYSTISIIALGAAYGTAKSGTGIAAMSVMRPDLIMKSVIPVVMAGIIAIYGLVVSVLIANQSKSNACLCFVLYLTINLGSPHNYYYVNYYSGTPF